MSIPVSPPREADLPFARRPMVNWFHPIELARAGVKAILSQLFGAYADNREIQALRPERSGAVGPSPRPTADYSGEESLWLDYVADLGDGWSPTYAVAQLLAAPQVQAATGSGPVTLRRGRVLVMGGDQVYPTATAREYQDRLEGPYRSALPYVDAERETPPDLFAIPGNHDWYDGLTSFTRFFCQGRWIGGWRTRQSKSYFALALPHGWWLWGIDVQLGSDIDEPQLDYFRMLGRSIRPPANVILCIAEPTWVKTDRGGLEAYDNLAYFEEETLHAFGHRHVVGLAGDLHTYARYRAEDGRLRFVSGGGGAYLYPTHRLPRHLVIPLGKPTERPRRSERLELAVHGDSAPPGAAADEASAAAARVVEPAAAPGGDPAGPAAGADRDAAPPPALYPPPDASWRLALRSAFFARYNPAFAALLGLYYLMLAWLIESASLALRRLSEIREGAGAEAEAVGWVPVLSESFLSAAQDGLGPMVANVLATLPYAPLAVLALVSLWGGLVAFADTRGWRRLALGTAHILLHAIAFVLVAFAAVRLLGGSLGPPSGPGPVEQWVRLALFALLMAGLGGLVAGLLWGIYLILAHLLGRDIHSNDVLACQSRTDYKHVLRLHVTAEGLTIYPLGLDAVPRRWRYKPNVGGGECWFDPDDGGPPIPRRAVLVEPPIVVRPPVVPAGGADPVPHAAPRRRRRAS